MGAKQLSFYRQGNRNINRKITMDWILSKEIASLILTIRNVEEAHYTPALKPF